MQPQWGGRGLFQLVWQAFPWVVSRLARRLLRLIEFIRSAFSVTVRGLAPRVFLLDLLCSYLVCQIVHLAPSFQGRVNLG